MTPDLREQLASLHNELARTKAVDAQSRDLLVTLLNDITRLLGTANVGTASDEERDVGDRLEALAVRFEAEHPSLSTALRRVVDALAKAGI